MHSECKMLILNDILGGRGNICIQKETYHKIINCQNIFLWLQCKKPPKLSGHKVFISTVTFQIKFQGVISLSSSLYDGDEVQYNCPKSTTPP